MTARAKNTTCQSGPAENYENDTLGAWRSSGAAISRSCASRNGKLRHQGADDATSKIIDTQTFVRNVGILSRYLEGTR
jgi:hypothetical protein